MLKKVWYNGGITYLLSFGLFILSMILPIYVVSIILTVIGLIFMGRSLQIDARHFSKSSSVEKKINKPYYQLTYIYHITTSFPDHSRQRRL